MKFRYYILPAILLLSLSTLQLTAVTVSENLNEELWEAARKGNTEKVKELIVQGVDVNTKARYGTTALFFAADRGHIEIVKLLVEKGADVNVKDTFYGSTALDAAIEKDHRDIVMFLLKSGATGADQMLVYLVESDDNYELVDLLLENAKIPAESLSKAFSAAEEAAAAGEKNGKIIERLEKAGGQPLPSKKSVPVDAQLLKSYEGTYITEGNEVKVQVSDNALTLQAAGRDPIKMIAVDEQTFQPSGTEGFTIAFQKEGSSVTAFKINREDGSSSLYSKVTASASTSETQKKPQPQTATTRTPSKKNWPSFRGWNASGVADGQNPPSSWNAEKSENILWKTPIPGLANSSPAVWEDRVFITTAISEDPNAALRHGLYGDVTPDKDVSKQTWRVYCLDRKSGKILWEHTATASVPEVKRHPKSSQANSTPATDGKNVVILLNSGDLLCYSLDGKLLWRQDLGALDSGWFYDPDYQWGFGSSPIIYQNLVFIQCDLQKGSYIAAFDIDSGKRVWMTQREEIPSWGTPTLYEGKNRNELIANGTNAIRAYDPLTGKELWKLTGNAEITVPTPIYSGDLIYVTSGYRPIQPIYAIRPGATGDISLAKDAESNEFVAWSKARGGPYMPTPIVYDGYLYTCANNGVIACYDARTGERIYQQRLGGKGSSYAFTASPVAADGRLYFTSEDGEIFVLKAGPDFEVIATNPMGEVCMATPAISEGMLIVRTLHHIYGIGKLK